MNCRNQKRLLLLVEPNTSSNSDLCSWLTHKGLRTWRANDVSHAIEELSDFTVRNRPDVVMLEATPISECFNALSANLGVIGGDDVSVVAMGSGHSSRPSPYFVTDYAQLERIIDRNAGQRSTAA